MTDKNQYEGTLMVRGKGTGFVKITDFEEDIIIDNRNLGLALDGDTILLEVLKKVPGKRREGKVKEVLKRAWQELIGVVKEETVNGKKQFILNPDNHRIHVRPILSEATAADLDMKVAVEITKWNKPELPPIAKIIEVLGRAGDHETEMQAIIRSGGFAKNFPPEVQAAADALYQNQAQIFKDAIADPKRRDFRNTLTFTIDPKDAKDFDDAISFKRLENGNYEIGIHIADVSHYVRPGDAIDKEARDRATSVYLVDRVIPMLPEILSNDLCSLRPHEDRLAFSAVYTVDETAEIKSEWYGQAIINSDHRFSYEDAQEAIDKGDNEHSATLQKMMDLARQLRKARYKAGAIAFEQPEVKFELDERGAPLRVYKKERTETMMMIEDFMLLANQGVATYINKEAEKRNQDLAFIYRIHDLPNPEKVEELAIFVHALGYEFDTDRGQVKAKAINNLMKQVEGKTEENLIKTAAIRSMAKAVYSTKNIGHFGLAFTYYTHFTSPIRRYPDMIAHRLLRSHLDNVTVGKSTWARFESDAVHSTAREIEAVSAERDSIKFKQVEYMFNRVGEEFNAIITGVADWGIYVQEEDSMAEGLVRLASIKYDYFENDPKAYQIKGSRTGDTYRLGDKVRVKLINANTEERQLDFELIKKS